MSFFQKKKVLLTGATGFVGGHLARRLIGEEALLRVLVRASSSKLRVAELQQLGAEVIVGDLTEASSVDQAVMGCDYVFHIGATFRQANLENDAYFQINVQGTRHVLDAAERHGVRKVIHCSTNGVHSHIEHPPADETAPIHPADIYQISKWEAEKLAHKRFTSGSLQGVILRPAMIWGEGDLRFLKLFRGIARRRLPIIGDGKSWTHWIYIDDLVDAFLLAAEKDVPSGEAFLIAGKRPVPLAYVFETIAKLAGVKVLPFKIPFKPLQSLSMLIETICKPFGINPPLYRRRIDFFIKNRSFKIEKAQRMLGFSPRYDFEEEAKRVYTWYKTQGLLD